MSKLWWIVAVSVLLAGVAVYVAIKGTGQGEDRNGEIRRQISRLSSQSKVARESAVYKLQHVRGELEVDALNALYLTMQGEPDSKTQVIEAWAVDCLALATDNAELARPALNHALSDESALIRRKADKAIHSK